jgi:hypothetical protein
MSRTFGASGKDSMKDFDADRTTLTAAFQMCSREAHDPDGQNGPTTNGGAAASAAFRLAQ